MYSADAAIMKFASFKTHLQSIWHSKVRGNAKNIMDAFSDYSIYCMYLSLIFLYSVKSSSKLQGGEMGNEAKINRQHQAEKKALKQDQVSMADTAGKAEAKEKDPKLARYFEKWQKFTYPTCTAYKHMKHHLTFNDRQCQHFSASLVRCTQLMLQYNELCIF